MFKAALVVTVSFMFVSSQNLRADWFQGSGCDQPSCGDVGGSGCDFLGCSSACDGAGACDGIAGDICGGGTGWKLSGWLNGGIIGNTDDPASRFNGPYNAVDRANEGTLNQAYFVLENEVPQSGQGLGGRVDFLFGTDFFLAESIGLVKRSDGSSHWNGDHYGIAIPQAYLSLGNQDAWLQVGHFYSVVGYEGLMAPSNFFYSKSYSYQFAGPFTHWGAQANFRPTNSVTMNLGIHNGWDAFDRISDRPGFIGKVRYDNANTGLWSSFAITTGDENNNPGAAPAITNRTRYSLLAGLPLTDRLNYVFHHWYGVQEDGAMNGNAEWYGIDQYLQYQVNSRWAAGLRFEWFNDDDGTRVGLNRGLNQTNPPLPGEYYSLTAGLNYTPANSLTIRPEIRADWYDGTALPYNDGTEDTQLMVGVDAIMTF